MGQANGTTFESNFPVNETQNSKLFMEERLPPKQIFTNRELLRRREPNELPRHIGKENVPGSNGPRSKFRSQSIVVM